MKNKNFNLKNKKAISIMIGYVLLITSAIVISGIVYQWMKTYVPKEGINCPDGVSVYIDEVKCEEIVYNSFLLNLTLKNNGRFNIAGYFIHATNSSEQELATIDLSGYTPDGADKGGSVIFGVKNFLNPGEKRKNIFDITLPINSINSVEIIPLRFQSIENKERLVSCQNAKIREEITCS
ncbi:MAG: hypothetical protein KJ646_02155 [Nanoarchaeota archaeon]|nr:hypothetical protein [Nanoarchaeota archaeon]MBU4116943.1 hypothetical protein [Nanoarchaeota archaeon]